MKVPGALIVLLAVGIGVVSTVFNCYAEGKSLALANGSQVPMKCYWSAMAEIAVIIPLVAVGGMLAFSKRKETRRTLAIASGVLGAVAMAVPTVLIGVCASPMMDCNSIMRPAVLLTGTLVMAVSIGSLIVSERRVEITAA